MRFRTSPTESLTYGELLESDTRRAIEVLNDSRVEIDSESREISIPSGFFETSREAIINDTSNALNEYLTRAAEYSLKTVNSSELMPENPFYKLSHDSTKNEDLDYEKPSDLCFEVWNKDDNQRKTAWGSSFGAIGSISYAIGGKEESAVLLGLSSAGFAGLNSYFRGDRDRTIEEAKEGLDSAYGDYDIVVEDQVRRKDKVEKAREWTKDVLKSL